MAAANNKIIILCDHLRKKTKPKQNKTKTKNRKNKTKNQKQKTKKKNTLGWANLSKLGVVLPPYYDICFCS